MQIRAGLSIPVVLISLQYIEKKPKGQILSPSLTDGGYMFQPSRKNTSDTHNSLINLNNKNNNEYKTNTYIGKDNYSLNSSKNFNNIKINSPNSTKTPSYITDMDSSYNQKIQARQAVSAFFGGDGGSRTPVRKNILGNLSGRRELFKIPLPWRKLTCSRVR